METLKAAFAEMCSCSNWSLQLLKISTSKTAGTKYASRQIQLEPESEMVSFISEISKKYLSGGKGSLDSFTDIVDYDGTASGTTIYRLTKDNALIASEYVTFLTEIANPDVEADPFSYTSAYVLKGVLSNGGDETPVKLVSMQSPMLFFASATTISALIYFWSCFGIGSIDVPSRMKAEFRYPKWLSQKNGC